MGTTKHILDGQTGSHGKKEVGNSFILPTITTTYCAHIMLGAMRLPQLNSKIENLIYIIFRHAENFKKYFFETNVA
jgi:hypothetical protein